MSVLPYATDFMMNKVPLIGESTDSRKSSQKSPYDIDDEEDDED